ncbi:MAG: hypothetical protein IJX87_06895 [Clostridia bacterium]|nr:hypothetical protein [Clostridia bacterium]
MHRQACVFSWSRTLLYAPDEKAALSLSFLHLRRFTSVGMGTVKNRRICGEMRRQAYVFSWSRTLLYAPDEKAALSLSFLHLRRFTSVGMGTVKNRRICGAFRRCNCVRLELCVLLSSGKDIVKGGIR